MKKSRFLDDQDEKIFEIISDKDHINVQKLKKCVINGWKVKTFKHHKTKAAKLNIMHSHILAIGWNESPDNYVNYLEKKYNKLFI